MVDPTAIKRLGLQWRCPCCQDRPRDTRAPFGLCGKCRTNWTKHQGDWRHFFSYEDIGPLSPNLDPGEIGNITAEPRPPRMPTGCNWWTMVTVWRRMAKADAILESQRTAEELRAWLDSARDRGKKTLVPPNARTILCAWYGLGEPAEADVNAELWASSPGTAGKTVRVRPIHAVYGLTLTCPVNRGGENVLGFLARIAQLEGVAHGPEVSRWRGVRQAAESMLEEARLAYAWAAERIPRVSPPSQYERQMAALDEIVERERTTRAAIKRRKAS